MAKSLAGKYMLEGGAARDIRIHFDTLAAMRAWAGKNPPLSNAMVWKRLPRPYPCYDSTGHAKSLRWKE